MVSRSAEATMGRTRRAAQAILCHGGVCNGAAGLPCTDIDTKKDFNKCLAVKL